MTKTVAQRDLLKLSTEELIAQYDRALSFGYKGRQTNCSPRQKRISRIVDLICDRAIDDKDTIAQAWLDAAK